MGASYDRDRLFSIDSPKAIKAQKYGYINAIHYMAPFTLGGVGNLCPHASAGCRALCLGEHSGQAGMVKLDTDMNSVRLSRRNKAQAFMRNRVRYMADLVHNLAQLERRAAKLGKKLCARMNGSSDIGWESIACERSGIRYRNIFEAFPSVQFVDYTKNPRRFARPLPANLHLTFSRSEINEREAFELLDRGHNVAAVFAPDYAGFYQRHNRLMWRGYPVTNGDEHDLRHLDPRGHIVALSPKGRKAKRDSSGFVIR